MNRPRSRSSVAAALLALFVAACSPGTDPGAGRRVADVAEALGAGPVEGFARALAPRAFEFPADHGAHPDFRSEWWYFTGNLGTPDGRRFGYHLTFFRAAVAPPGEEHDEDSRWRTRQVWMAHFAVLDVAADRVHTAERLARGALDLAGADTEPFRVWVEGWQAMATEDDSFLPLRLSAADGDVAIDLTLRPGKPLVLHGDDGLSRKSSAPGNASYYYSFTRVPVAGTVTVAGRVDSVEGLGWVDREWSTSALAADQVGWDWFSIQLDDGRELMWYQLRRADGRADPASAGTLIFGDGSTEHLAATDVELEPGEVFVSPRSGASYPVGWRLRVPRADLDLVIAPRRRDQELGLSFRYWEGAITVSGSAAGSGYLEMTGY